MKDIDMSILGRDPATYQTYSQQIREEWRDIYPEDSQYAKGRSAALNTILKSGNLYQTNWFKQKYEKQSFVNIHRELDNLSK